MITEKYYMKQLLTLLTLFWISNFALASCDNPQNNLEMKVCSFKELESYQKELDTLVKSYSTKISSDISALFIESNNTWGAHRDAQCDFRASAVSGGSAHALVLNNCLTTETQKRIVVLNGLLRCAEGDLSCP
jgi:uncharacterized protein YecT (DUF1311 family)